MLVITYGRGSTSEEDKGAQVRSALVWEGTGSIDQSTNTIWLDGRAEQRASPWGSSSGSFLRLEELLARVGALGAAVSIAEDGTEDSKGDSVVEGRAEGNGRGLDRGKVCSDAVSYKVLSRSPIGIVCLTIGDAFPSSCDSLFGSCGGERWARSELTVKRHCRCDELSVIEDVMWCLFVCWGCWSDKKCERKGWFCAPTARTSPAKCRDDLWRSYCCQAPT